MHSVPIINQMNLPNTNKKAKTTVKKVVAKAAPKDKPKMVRTLEGTIAEIKPNICGWGLINAKNKCFVTAIQFQPEWSSLKVSIGPMFETREQARAARKIINKMYPRRSFSVIKLGVSK